MSKLHIKKGDQVQVIAGDSKGQTGQGPEGRGLRSSAPSSKGVNLCKKATKPNAQNPQGGIVKKEAPIRVSNLQAVDPEERQGDAQSVAGLNADGEIRSLR